LDLFSADFWCFSLLCVLTFQDWSITQVSNIKGKISLREIAAQPQGPFLIWDQEVRGFCARRQFSETITYSIAFRTQTGLQRWMKIGRHGILTPAIARTEAIRILRAVTLGKDPANDRYALRSGANISELLDQYVADMQSGKINGKKSSTIKSDKSLIETHIRPHLGKLKIVAITQEQIENFMNQCSLGSARRIIALLSAVFSFAVRKGLRSDNPCSNVKKPADVRRIRRLSEAEYAQLGKALNGGGHKNDIAMSVIKFLAISGFRSGEVLQLKWQELDIERCIVTLENTKTGRSIRPLSQTAIKIIQAQKRTSEYVFGLGRPISDLRYQWEKLGLAKDITPHVLRHSYASLAADLGMPDHTISRLLGHAQKSVTSRYIHVERSLIEAADKVAIETLRLMQIGLDL
jgi:integrase